MKERNEEQKGTENSRKSNKGKGKTEKINEIKNGNSEADSEDDKERENGGSLNDSDQEQNMMTINKKIENTKTAVQKNLEKGTTLQDISTTSQEVLLKQIVTKTTRLEKVL